MQELETFPHGAAYVQYNPDCERRLMGRLMTTMKHALKPSAYRINLLAHHDGMPILVLTNHVTICAVIKSSQFAPKHPGNRLLIRISNLGDLTEMPRYSASL
jgi:hypothetical protein